ncbi:unnamed protein product [Prorocentrum cordatum]|uniref:Peptidase A1 domain-containing protein n=1 Tax=Prorocentrum cordatum TaxID=2364126 RepID=A0ABN9SX90_9DINO|nr:unnamed protein product [Polarella glacialis]
MMRVDGFEIQVPHGRTIIDSGTTYTYLNHNVYMALRYAIEDYCARHEGCGAYQTGICWEVVDGTPGLERFPDIEVIFESTVTRWVPRAYLYRKSLSSKYCYAFADDGTTLSTTLGASWMQHQDILFDMARRKVGIAPAVCPEWRTRPAHIANISVGGTDAPTPSPSPGTADAVAPPTPPAPAAPTSSASSPPPSPSPPSPSSGSK